MDTQARRFHEESACPGSSPHYRDMLRAPDPRPRARGARRQERQGVGDQCLRLRPDGEGTGALWKEASGMPVSR